MGATYAATPAHIEYGRAWLILERLPTDKKLRKKILHIIQEEAFVEPGLEGIERRAWLASVALAHLRKSGSFPALRWGGPEAAPLSMNHRIIRHKNRLILLCDPLQTKVGFNPSLPLAVTVTHPKVRDAKDA